MKTYKAWILDFDGTLTRSLPVRLLMAAWLVGYYFLHPTRLREIFLLRDWRRLREERFCAAEENFRTRQVEELSRRYALSVEAVEKILRTWMVERPQKILRHCTRRSLIAAAEAQQRRGVKLIVYSDNSAREKVAAIDFPADEIFSADDEFISCMKPDARGLKKILAHMNLKPEDVLYIGDRHDRDGICAEAAGVDYCDVKILENFFRASRKISAGGE